MEIRDKNKLNLGKFYYIEVYKKYIQIEIIDIYFFNENFYNWMLWIYWV